MSRKKTFNEFIEEAKRRHPDSHYEYDESTYINTHTPMRIICPKHGEFWVTPKSHLLYECKSCSYEKRGRNYMMTTEEFIKKAYNRHYGNKYDYSKTIYKGTKIPICIICSKHGEFWQTPNDHLSGKGCPKCNESQLEKKVRKFLVKNNINYIPQYKVKWLGRQSLDFYLPDYNLGIECQGKQHFGIGGWTDNFDFNKIYQCDEKKYKLCEKNKINLIYIVDNKDKSYIKEDIIYKDKIYTDFNDILLCIHKKK